VLTVKHWRCGGILCYAAGTVADSELQPIVIPSASLLPNLLLCVRTVISK